MGARRYRRRLAALVVASLVAVPAGAASGAPAGDLDRTREQLEAAGRELEEVTAAIRQVNDEVASADARLREAGASLAAVRDELAEATSAAEAAAATERDAAGRLAEVGAELEELTTRHRDGRDRLAEQAVTTYKRGGTATPGLLLGGVLQAGDLHELAVTRDVLTRVLTDQRDTVLADRALTRATATASGRVGDARREAVAAARTAAEERRRVAALVVEQEELVATIEHRTEERRAALARLERDAAARGALVRELEGRVAAMELAATSVRVPVDVDVPHDGPPPPWAAALPPSGRTWAATVDAVAVAHGIDGRLLAALVWTESNFHPGAVSHAGALGLTQLMPATARGLGVDPRDPVQNLAGGARYLATQLEAFGRVDLALAAYNAGPGRVRRAGGAVPDIVETQLYVVRVLDRFEALRSL